jgi:hypothetical protein
MARQVPIGERRLGVEGVRGGGVARAYGAPRTGGPQAVRPFGMEALARAVERLGAPIEQEFRAQVRVAEAKASRESAQAGMTYGLEADPDDLQLPPGDTIGEEAFRRTALQAAGAKVEIKAREDVATLRQQFAGKPEDFKKALVERQSKFLGGLPPELSGDAMMAYERLGAAAYLDVDEERRALERDAARADLLRLTDQIGTSAAQLARAGRYEAAMEELTHLGEKTMAAGPVALGGSGALSLTEIEKQSLAAGEMIRSNFLEGWAERTPNKRAALQGLRTGRTGDPVADAVLAATPPDTLDQFTRVMEADIKAEESLARQEARQAAALALAERTARLSLAKDVVRDSVFALQAGKVPPNLSEVAGIVGEFPELKSQLSAAMAQQEAAAEFVTLPPIQRQNILLDLKAQPEMDRQQIEFTQALEKRHTELAGASDKYAAAVDAGLVPPVPLDVADPTSIAARAEAADVIESTWGDRTSGIRDDEVAAIKDKLNTMTPEDQAATLGSLSTTLGDKFPRLLPQIAGKDPSLAMAAKVAPNEPALAGKVLQGRMLVKEGVVQAASPDTYAQTVKDKLGTALKHSPSGYAGVMEAAGYLEAARRFEAGNVDKDSYDEDGLSSAIDEITGGVFEYNGQPIIAPERGVDEDTFAEILGSIDDGDLSVADDAGRLMLPTMSTGAPLTAQAFRDYATLESAGDGKYLVRVANGYAMDPRTGQPFLFDWQGNTAGARRRLQDQTRTRREGLLGVGDDDIAGNSGADRLAPGVGGTLSIPLNPQLGELLRRILTGDARPPAGENPPVTEEAARALGIPARN